MISYCFRAEARCAILRCAILFAFSAVKSVSLYFYTDSLVLSQFHYIGLQLSFSFPHHSTVNMRTEAEFVEQAELARSSLQQFIAVQDFDNADEIKRGALNKVMKNIVSVLLILFSPFAPLL
jgi:hypothetical protein